jgi:hypothetical protein
MDAKHHDPIDEREKKKPQRLRHWTPSSLRRASSAVGDDDDDRGQSC